MSCILYSGSYLIKIWVAHIRWSSVVGWWIRLPIGGIGGCEQLIHTMCYLFWHGRYPDTPWFALTCWVVSASLATLCLISWYECLSVRTKWVSSELLFLHSSPPWTGKHVLPDSVRSLPIRRGLRAQVRNGNRYIYGQFKGRLVWTSAHVDGSSKKDPLACWSNWLFVQQTLTVPHPYVLVFTFWIVPRLGHGLMLHRCQSCPSAKLPHSLFLTTFFSPTSPYLLLFIFYHYLHYLLLHNYTTTISHYYYIIT